MPPLALPELLLLKANKLKARNPMTKRQRKSPTDCTAVVSVDMAGHLGVLAMVPDMEEQVWAGTALTALSAGTMGTTMDTTTMAVQNNN